MALKHGLPFIHEPKPGYFVYRRKGRTTPINAPFGTEEFYTIYWQIRNGTAKPSRTSWAALIASYRQSARWSKLKPRTRKDYEGVLDYINETMGRHDVTRFRRPLLIEAMEANRDRVRFANYIAQVTSILCEHAINLGWVTVNHAKGAPRLDTPKGKKQAHIPWPDWAVKQWREEARPVHRLIFEIGIGSVQRPADWALFRWSDYDGDGLRLTQGKTDKPLWLPCTEHLRAALDSAPKNGLTILTTREGRPVNYDWIARNMLFERKRLGLEAYDQHALRYRGVMELAWAGCTDDEIASYSGHTSKAMIAKYAGEARQRMRALQAREKRR